MGTTTLEHVSTMVDIDPSRSLLVASSTPGEEGEERMLRASNGKTLVGWEQYHRSWVSLPFLSQALVSQELDRPYPTYPGTSHFGKGESPDCTSALTCSMMYSLMEVTSLWHPFSAPGLIPV